MSTTASACGIIIDEGIAHAAFEMHRLRYASKRDWNPKYHLKLWSVARQVWADASLPQFRDLYEELRLRWTAFRGGQSRYTAEQAFHALNSCDSSFSRLCLSRVESAQSPGLWQLIQSLDGLKRNKTGPSVVAVSKFLHFWNPRLFVIVDDAVVWRWVLRRWWLWKMVEEVRRELGPLLSPYKKTSNAPCRTDEYMAVIIWAARFIRENPCIISAFAEYLRGYAVGSEIGEYAEYEAAAVEWFLLGLVELPPANLSIQQ